jgi:WD40 repeat protein
MNNRWQKIDEVFHAALAVKIEDRRDFINRMCEGDDELRREIETLVANRSTPVDIIDHPPVDDGFRLLAGNRWHSLEGALIQHYKVLTRIGEGGMGEVYAALDQRLNRKVALKFLPQYSIDGEQRVKQLTHEARATSALNHPNIVTIYDLGQEGSLHFIAMELVEGETLRRRLSAKLSFPEIINIAIQVTRGLAAAHQAGILHRDIKPDNIIETSDGVAKILDFGIAKFRKAQESTILQNAGNLDRTVAGGTLGYMSPEQARGESLDARTDIFSLGAVLFELVTGRRPFAGETHGQMLNALLNDDAPPLNIMRPDVPADLERIIHKTLRKNPNDRYQSAREVLADLEEFNRDAGSALEKPQRANWMFKQYLSNFAVDPHALIPLSKLHFIWKHSDRERGERARALLKKSLQAGLVKSSALVVLFAVLTVVGAAALSVDERWDQTILRDGHVRAARQAAFSPDGRLLVTVGEDNRVIVWDFASRMSLAVLTDHKDIVTSVAFSPDGKLFATGSFDGTAIVWDSQSLKLTEHLKINQGRLIAIAFSPDSSMLATASSQEPINKGPLILWNTSSWNKVREFAAKAGPYGMLLFKSNRELVSGEQRWNIQTGEELPMDVPSNGNWLAYSPNRRHIVVMSGGGAIGSLDLDRDSGYHDLPAHEDSGRGAAFTRDGKLLATAADDIVLWEPTTMTLIARLTYPAIVWNVTFSPDDKSLVASYGDGSIVVWSVADHRPFVLNGHSGPVRSVAFSPDGQRVASASEDRSVIVWDLLKAAKDAVFKSVQGRFTAVEFNNTAKNLLAVEFEGNLHEWNNQTKESISHFFTHASTYCIAVSRDDRWIAATPGVYNKSDGSQVIDFYTAIGHVGCQMYGVAFSPDGHSLVGASPMGVVSLFDTSNWKLRGKVQVEKAQFISVSFSPDGKTFVTGDDDGSVVLWSVEPLRRIALIGRHESRVKSVAFSPDGAEVCSAGDDATIRLWNVQSRKLVSKIGTHTTPVLAIAFSPDGKKIVSGEHDASVRVYTRHRTLWGWTLN